MAERGVIRNREAAAQIKDFSGMSWGNITPMDIDMFVEFWDKVYIVGEMKFMDAELRPGQRLALERLCDVCRAAGKRAAAIIMRHSVPARSGQDIIVDRLPVVEYRYKGRWLNPRRVVTAREFVQEFVYGKGSTAPLTPLIATRSGRFEDVSAIEVPF